MLNRRIAYAGMLILALTETGLAQSKRNPPQTQPVQTQVAPPAQTASPDQRGTDQQPFAVKVFPAPKAKEQADQDERWRQEKAEVDKRLADETQRLADETGTLARITIALVVAAILQIGLFFWQLLLIQGEAKRARITREQARDIERAYISGGGAPDDGRGFFYLTVNNYGKTPGTLTEYGIGFCAPDKLPPVPIYERTKSRGTYEPGARAQPIARKLIPRQLSGDFIVYGRFWYFDIWNACHEFGFILRPIAGKELPDNIPAAYTHMT